MTWLHAEDFEKSFKRDFIAAVSTSDKALFSLVEFHELTPKFFNEALKSLLVDVRQRTIKKVGITEPTESDVVDFIFEGVAYTSTLPITKNLVIHFEPEPVTVGRETSAVISSTFMLGVKEGAYRIVAIMPQGNIQSEHTTE